MRHLIRSVLSSNARTIIESVGMMSEWPHAVEDLFTHQVSYSSECGIREIIEKGMIETVVQAW
jgi:hypothetical protein